MNEWRSRILSPTNVTRADLPFPARSVLPGCRGLRRRGMELKLFVFWDLHRVTELSEILGGQLPRAPTLGALR
jgi:hypothetical protein